jgi:hypothetical protein
MSLFKAAAHIKVPSVVVIITTPQCATRPLGRCPLEIIRKTYHIATDMSAVD